MTDKHCDHLHSSCPKCAPTEESRLWAVGDIHGRDDLLKPLLDSMLIKGLFKPKSRDKIIFMGDYIDRGFYSKLVVDRLMKWEKDFPNQIVCLRGNHENFAIKVARARGFDKGKVLKLWTYPGNGGSTTIASFGAMPDEPAFKPYLEWFESLPLSHEEPGFFFSHAPVPRENRREQEDKGKPFTEHELTWSYSPDEPGHARNFGDGVIGVCGHKHKLHDGVWEPRFYDHYIFTDAGCGCHPRAPLYAVEVKTRNTFHAAEEDD